MLKPLKKLDFDDAVREAIAIAAGVCPRRLATIWEASANLYHVTEYHTGDERFSGAKFIVLADGKVYSAAQFRGILKSNAL